jgi:signal transduction histidine kinase
VLPWDGFFGDLLNEGVDGIVVVVDDGCGKSFTFQINGPDIVYLGLTDHHDPKYDHMAVITYFDGLANDEGSCNYKFTIYPSDDFARAYITHKPVVYSLVVCSIFAMTVLSFMLYDSLVERRQRKSVRRLTQAKARYQAEKALLLVQSANSAAHAERYLNDYIAHEVRNPLSAAMSATSFVVSAMSEPDPLKDPETLESVREDAAIVEQSLQFVNDLLRNIVSSLDNT